MYSAKTAPLVNFLGTLLFSLSVSLTFQSTKHSIINLHIKSTMLGISKFDLKDISIWKSTFSVYCMLQFQVRNRNCSSTLNWGLNPAWIHTVMFQFLLCFLYAPISICESKETLNFAWNCFSHVLKNPNPKGATNLPASVVEQRALLKFPFSERPFGSAWSQWCSVMNWFPWDSL